MDRGAWQATVHGFAKNWTQLSKQNCAEDTEQRQSLGCYEILKTRNYISMYAYSLPQPHINTHVKSLFTYIIQCFPTAALTITINLVA